jgi:hypothetical protein
VRRDVDAQITLVRTDLDTQITLVRRDLDELRSEMRSEFAVVRLELRSELRGEINRLMLWLFPTILTGLALAFAAARVP